MLENTWELARILCTAGSIHSMPAHRMGRFWKFKKDEVDEWVRAGGAVEKEDK